MKSTKLIAGAFMFFAVASTGSYAQLQLPAPSPKASVMQTVGLTEITIDYSSPGVKGRTIWGELVPYDQLWRTGANSATQISFSKDVTINGTQVPKGKYSFFTIPGKTDWTLILNKNATASTGEYKKEEDIVRMNVKPEAIPSRERMTFIFADFDDNSANINLEWEKIRVTMPVKVGTADQAKANIKSSLGGTWRTYNSAARYMLDQKNYDEGLVYVEQSIKLSDEWFNNWTKAQLLAGKGNYKEAYASAQKAKELGDKSEMFFFKDQVEKALVEWKGK